MTLPVQLEDVNWRLNLQMAQSTRAKMKQPNALFEFSVREGEVRGQSVAWDFAFGFLAVTYTHKCVKNRIVVLHPGSLHLELHVVSYPGSLYFL